MRYTIVVCLVGVLVAEQVVAQTVARQVVAPGDKSPGKEAWYGYVLVRPSRMKLGFFLSLYDRVANEVVVSSDDTVIDMHEKAAGRCSVYEVPDLFQSIVREVAVCGNQVTGIIRILSCSFSIEAEELPWLKDSDTSELEGRLFHLMLPVEERQLIQERCSIFKQKGAAININTKK